MAEFSQAEKLNLVNKLVFGIQGTSNTDDSLGLAWYEELFPYLQFIRNNELFAKDVPYAENYTEAEYYKDNNSFIDKVDLKLTEVSRTNGRAWGGFATYGDEDSTLLGDWLQPQVFGKGYALHLYQDNGSGTAPDLTKEITTTDGAWIPAYKIGFIILADNETADDKGWTKPLWARVYRYTGPKGIDGSTAGVDLQDAYDASNSEEKIINVNDGSLEINSTGTYAHMTFNSITNPPTTDLQDGAISRIGNDLYMYNSATSKWLSIDKSKATFSIRVGDGRYLQYGKHGSSNSGYYCGKDLTLVSITAKGGSGNQTKGFSIRKAGSTSDISTFVMTAGVYSDNAVNIDFNAGETVQVYCSASGSKINNPVVTLEFAVRES